MELDGSHWISAVRLLDEALELREITVTRVDGAERRVLVNETSDWPLPEAVFNGDVGYLGQIT